MNEECLFCSLPEKNYRTVLFSSDHLYAIWDSYPVSPGHILLITKDHRSDYFELDPKEKEELHVMIRRAKEFILENDHAPDGYNIGMNCGQAAGQTIMHFHCHVIPRYRGDMRFPRGGVRHCIPEKGGY